MQNNKKRLYRLRRHNIMNHLLGQIDHHKRLLKLYPNTEWIKTNLITYKRRYDWIKNAR
jgi:hypothetical protein